ncbi:MAG: gliding motility-associated C-terminal domain-containing protein, partial [Prolixibacteraceae bacterium]|nr:gliding motility-associated C-terminal domain-containing protein [Prolixibacteraceae bacterium]
IQWNTVEPGDLVINEVLFNPFPGGNDFVEIYNNSEKYISENRLFLATRNDTLQLKQIYPFSESKNLFLPHRYLALTKDTNGVFPWFRIECPECFRQMEKFPSFKDDDDYVVLLNEKMHVIDEFFYTEKMYSPLLADDEGISLERVSFTGETNSADNWHSASTASGYGTPGYLNSEVENKNITKPEITFSPESFSPNNDGYNDRYKIQYQLEKPGYIANCWIFDAGGRFVMQLIKNEILGTSGEILWNGENETGQRQSLGVYVVIFEIIDSAGNVHRYKDGVVLTDILE